MPSSDDERAKEPGSPPSNDAENLDDTQQEAAPSVEENEAASAAATAADKTETAHDDDDDDEPSPTDSRSEEGEARSDDSPAERAQQPPPDHAASAAPPLPNEPTPGAAAPPLPAEAPPGQAAAADADDGWTALWDASNQTWYFYNARTGVSQWTNPRLTPAAATTTPSTTQRQQQISHPTSIAGGYNPAIHGSWDPTASYAQQQQQPSPQAADAADDAEYQVDLALYDAEMAGSDPTTAAEGFALFNKRTGKAQAADQGPERHSDASKSLRQMNAYFNVDQAANSHDGRSLKAERRGKQPTKKELSLWKEKRKARKEEKRRAWLRD